MFLKNPILRESLKKIVDYLLSFIVRVCRGERLFLRPCISCDELTPFLITRGFAIVQRYIVLE